MLLHVELDARPDRAGDRARKLAATGIDGLFTFEGQHDVFLPLAAAAATTDVELMTNVAIALPRSPLHLAHTAYDLQLLSAGRFRLGLGSQIRPHIESRYGSTWSRPAARMRETVLAVRAILDAWQHKQRLEFRGEFTKHTLMTPAFNPGPNRYGIPPIYLGALGPLMTRAAAEVADGLLVMPFHSVRHFRERTLPAIDDGLRRSGRARADFDIFPQVIAAIGRTDSQLAAAAAGVRALLGVLRVDPRLSARARGRGARRTATPAQRAVQAHGGRRNGQADRRRPADHPRGPGHPGGMRRRDPAAGSATWHSGSACTSPGYDVPDADIRALAAALHAG